MLSFFKNSADDFEIAHKTLSILAWSAVSPLTKKKIRCLKAAAHICFLVCVWFSKIQAFNFFPFYSFSSKIYIKRNDRYTKTHWTINFLNSVLWFFLVSSSTKNEVPYFTLDKSCDRCILDTPADKKKTTLGKKTVCHIGFPICHKLWDRIFFFFL